MDEPNHTSIETIDSVQNLKPRFRETDSEQKHNNGGGVSGIDQNFRIGLSDRRKFLVHHRFLLCHFDRWIKLMFWLNCLPPTSFDFGCYFWFRLLEFSVPFNSNFGCFHQFQLLLFSPPFVINFEIGYRYWMSDRIMV